MAATSSRKTRLTALVVEGDNPTRGTMAHLLERKGYVVLTAADSGEALSLLGQPLAPVAVALLGVDPLNLNGLTLCAHLHKLCPRPVIVLWSDTPHAPEIARLLELGFRHCRRKPASPSGLRTALERALLRESPAAGRRSRRLGA